MFPILAPNSGLLSILCSRFLPGHECRPTCFSAETLLIVGVLREQ